MNYGEEKMVDSIEEVGKYLDKLITEIGLDLEAFIKQHKMYPACSDRSLVYEMLKNKEKFGITKFYETGSHLGKSTKILSMCFDEIYSCEVDQGLYQQAVSFNADASNVKIENKSSPQFLRDNLKEAEENLGFFLDAHWYRYWPLLDELRVIAEKRIRPVIFIHDFYVPDGHGGAKFYYTKTPCGTQSLDFDYAREAIEGIYGIDGYEYYYIQERGIVDSGVGIFHPKL